jgi:WD40-like Beta Propeller Repeat
VKWNEPMPHEREAGERSWEVVRSAWEARTPHPRPRRNRARLIAVAVALAVLAAILSPPGLAVLGSIRDAVSSKTVRDELRSLPAAGRLLVDAPAGVWVVQQDGSKRFLSGYLDASWSPHGLYLAAARGNELVAMEPNGKIHWTLARSGPIGAPQWSFEGYRIAYLSGPALRVVNGDGTGDRRIRADVVGTGLPAFAWRPGTHQLAYKNHEGMVLLEDLDRTIQLWQRRAHGVERLLWSDDGRRLYVAASPAYVVDERGKLVASVPSTPFAAFRPHGHALALVVAARGRSSVVVYSGRGYRKHRVVFSAPGVFGGIAWSPDGRWLLVDWRSADEWIFIRSTGGRRVVTAPNISDTFRTSREAPTSIAGWCCTG